MKKFFIVLFLSISIVSKVSAWNFNGHVLVGQIAFNHLSLDEENKVEREATALFEKLPVKLQNKLNRYYPGTSTFAKTMVLADMWRHKRLGTLFHWLRLSPPIVLYPFLKYNMAAWHFDNKPYATTKIPKIFCHQIKFNNVKMAISLLKKALADPFLSDPATLGLLNALLGHYIGDAHQPLHTMSEVSHICRMDGGGNQFCLGKISAKGNCGNNLHHLWDTGVGTIKGKEDMQVLTKSLELEFSKTDLTTEMNDLTPKNWVNSNFKFASFIYSTMPGTKPSQTYYQQGQAISRKQLYLAGLRLAKIIESIEK